MDLGNTLEFLDSEDCKQKLNDFTDKLIREDAIKSSQLKRFHKYIKENNNFDTIVQKVITKYNSNDYRNRWYKRSIEPPENLYWFLFNYAAEYGRDCNKLEWEKYSCDFTSEIIFINGYYFERLNGQGSFIKVRKLK